MAIHRSTILETPKKISGGLLHRSFEDFKFNLDPLTYKSYFLNFFIQKSILELDHWSSCNVYHIGNTQNSDGLLHWSFEDFKMKFDPLIYKIDFFLFLIKKMCYTLKEAHLNTD